ncbi:MAG TPA: ribulose-phosphate 3-epimerase [Nitrososphaeraceae archaeon]|jgi:transketolase|nr:ribulose-phosphate 3-epimerase [Nitrososphaeraceae archaeon]
MSLKIRYLNLRAKIRDIRMLAIMGIAEAGSGHPGASFSAAEIMGSLYFRIMKHDPCNPQWSERDYFVNSKAHSAPGYYATLSVAGYFPADEMSSLRKLGSRLQGHPVRYSVYQKDQSVPGIEYSGGSEGIGLSVAIGIALASKMDGKKNHVYVLIGDGESDEGQIWEAAMAASKFKLDNITVILDRNRIQQDGFTEDIMPLDPVRDKWAAFNWSTEEVNGHNIEQIIDAFNKTNQVKDRPSIIIANTIKGNGIKHMTNNPQWHGKAPPRKHTPLLLEELENECLIAPSIIAGEPENYEDKIRKAERGGADMIHLDIMDGKFVNNTTMSAETIKKLRHITSLPFDAHLMIEKPLRHIDKFIEARCDIITVHAETCNEDEFVEIAERLLQNGISPGIAINPSTDLPYWFYSHLEKIDVLIVMSVNPGFSGQQFLPEVLQKMTVINRKLTEHGYKGYIEADGGIDSRTLQQVYDAGAKIVVTGNAVYGSSDIHSAIIQLKHKANVALEKRLLTRSTGLGIRQDWIKARRHILIPLANELGIEEELNATK